MDVPLINKTQKTLLPNLPMDKSKYDRNKTYLNPIYLIKYYEQIKSFKKYHNLTKGLLFFTLKNNS